MNLPEAARRQLEIVVLRALGVHTDADTLRMLVGWEAIREGPEVSGARRAEWVVRFALTRPTPRVFIELVELCDPGGKLVEIHVLVAELKADPGKWKAGVGGLWVPTGWPFIDRRDVRVAMTAMANGGGPPAIAIEGPFGHGKETVGEYVCYLASDTGAFRAVVLKLQGEPVPGLLTSIATRAWMTLEEPADTDTTHTEPERQAAILAGQIAKSAANGPTPTWVVANIVSLEGLEEEGVLAFLDELLRLVHAVPEFAKKLRIVLLCDQLSLLELEHAPPVAARHTLAQVNDAEVREWFEAATPGKSPALYDFTTQSVMSFLANADPPPGRRLELLSRKCASARKNLEAAP